VQSGGSATGAIISGTQLVYGTVTSTQVASGGNEWVSGGSAVSGTVLSGGVETVQAGGRDSGTTVDGTEVVQGGGSATQDMVASGGTVLVQSGGSLNNVTISGGGSGANINGTIVEVNSGGSVSNVTFAGAGMLVLDSSSAFSGVVSGFTTSSEGVDLRDIHFASGVHFTTFVTGSGASATTTLNVSAGANSATITFAGSGHAFTPSPDSLGGTIFTDPPATGGGAMLLAQYAAGFQSEVGGVAGGFVTTPTSRTVFSPPPSLTKPT
jgi:autotransporter passenger strand-loop-strand repeat protein